MCNVYVHTVAIFQLMGLMDCHIFHIPLVVILQNVVQAIIPYLNSVGLEWHGLLTLATTETSDIFPQLLHSVT